VEEWTLQNPQIDKSQSLLPLRFRSRRFPAFVLEFGVTFFMLPVILRRFSTGTLNLLVIPPFRDPIWGIARMRRNCIQVRFRIGLLILAGLPAGCQHYDPVANSTFVGSGLGAATGAIIGSDSGNAGAGALIGAAAGALGGALVGDAEQARAQRDSAYAYAQGVSQSQQYSASAVTNSDVIYMAQNGLGNDVIINSINTRGGRFDTSPSSLIQLKSAGVSDSVISVMQNSGPAIAPVNYVVPPPAPAPANILVVQPPPPRPVIFAPYAGPRYYRYPHRPPQPGIFIQGRF
jgi:uncharacterized protein YcfJ